MFSGSESVVGRLFSHRAKSLSISFWFSPRILVRSNIISHLKDVFTSSKFSGWIRGDLLGPATELSGWLLSPTEDSNSPEASSATAFLFRLLVVFFQVGKKEGLWE